MITAPGEGGGIFTTNMPARGWLSDEELSKKRADLIALNIVGARDGSGHVDYTVNAITGFSMVTGPVGHDGLVNAVRRVGPCDGLCRRVNDRRRRAASPDDGAGAEVVLPLQDMALPSPRRWAHRRGRRQRGRPPRFGNEIFGTFGRDFKTKDAASS